MGETGDSGFTFFCGDLLPVIQIATEIVGRTRSTGMIVTDKKKGIITDTFVRLICGVLPLHNVMCSVQCDFIY
jgi:hypothetical protein